MNNRDVTVCFSGHRILKDPKSEIEAKLEIAIRECIDSGSEVFMTGGALGVDTLAAWTVIRLKTEYPHIQLVLALPCPTEEQSIKWTAKQKNEYQQIIEQADEVRILSDVYTKDCMLERNDYMVDNSSKMVYYLRYNRGGTKHTVKYAQSKGIELIGI